MNIPLSAPKETLIIPTNRGYDTMERPRAEANPITYFIEKMAIISASGNQLPGMRYERELAIYSMPDGFICQTPKAAMDTKPKTHATNGRKLKPKEDVTPTNEKMIITVGRTKSVSLETARFLLWW